MFFTRLMSRYIGRHFLLSFLSGMLVILGMILLFDTIELLRQTADVEGVQISDVLAMALFRAPQMLQIVLPFAVMVGGMITFWRLTRSHELVVARAAGFSVWQVLAPVLTIAMLIGVLNVAALNPIGAMLYARFEKMEESLLQSGANPLALGRSGLWLREGGGGRQAVVHAEDVRQEGLRLLLSGVTIFHLDARDNFTDRIDAESGVLSQGEIRLNNVFLMRPGALPQQMAELSLPTTLTLSRIQDNFASPETMSFWELPAFIRFFEDAGFSAHKHRLYYESLVASPFLLIAMVLIAAVFSLRPNQRGGGILMRVTSGVLAGFALYFFSKLVYALGLSDTLPISLAAWSPTVVTMLAGATLILHQEDG